MPAPEHPLGSPLAAWLTLLAGLAAALGALLGGQAAAAWLDPEPLELAITGFYVLLFGPLLVLPLVLGALTRRDVLRGGENRWRWAAAGLAGGIGGLGVAVGLTWLHGSLRPGEVAAASAASLALGLGLTLFQVTAEEAMFRGWLFPALAERIGLAGGIVGSAVAFAGFHLVGGAGAPLSLLNLALGGAWFALLARRSGGLVAPVAAHFGWNVAEDIGLGLVPNPGVGVLGALTNFDLRGPGLWGGSAEGLNASAAMSVVLVALIVPLAWPRHAGRLRPGGDAA